MNQFALPDEFETPSLFLPAETPILRLSKQKLIDQSKRFQTGFPGLTTYAVKANPHKQVVKTFVDSGIRKFDVASISEMKLVRDIEPQAQLHYHNPVRSEKETSIAFHVYGCRRYSIDHESSLVQLAAQTENRAEVEVAIRFRMTGENSAIQSFQSKFGVDSHNAVRLVDIAGKLGFRVGLTFHPGSQTTDPLLYQKHITEAAKIHAKSLNGIEFLNVGGGFPSHYNGINAPDLECYFETIRNAVRRAFGETVVRLECEPGRALVAGAGTLVTMVKQVRPETMELYLDDGIYGGLMEFHQFPKLEPVYECTPKRPANEFSDWTVYGPTCDPVDVLPKKLRLPTSVEAGDTIQFSGTGAYSQATATRFNGYGAIEVQMV